MPTVMPKLRPTWLCQRLCPWLRSQDYANNYTQGDAHNYVYGYAYDNAYDGVKFFAPKFNPMRQSSPN